MGPVAGDAVNPSMGAWPRHPCRGHSRNRTHPAFDSFLRPACISVEPSHARLLFDQFPKYSISMEIHPRMAWIYWPPATGQLSKAGHCGFAGCEPHGCGDQAPMDGFTAAPQAHSALPFPRKPLWHLTLPLLAASAGAGRSPADPP
ncbi:hypothetical protein D7Y34_09395 [Stenotrophomonas maltophilia]|nr:hypothetical protein [Stenotrophomonas maltophilia]